MKKHFFLFSVLIIVLQSSMSAQVINYQKLKVPSVDAAGKAYDATGKFLGKLSRDGLIFDDSDKKIAHVDAFGNVVDEASGESFGKSDMEGNYLIVAHKKVITWKSFHPENPGIQLCLIKNKNNEVVATVHKSYKQQGTGALYYLVSKFATPVEVKAAPTTETKTTSVKKKTTSVKKKTKTTTKAKGKKGAKAKK